MARLVPIRYAGTDASDLRAFRADVERRGESNATSDESNVSQETEKGQPAFLSIRSSSGCHPPPPTGKLLDSKLTTALHTGFIFLVALLGCGCDQHPPTTISGQVFIATKGGQTFTLSLTPVSIYTGTTFLAEAGLQYSNDLAYLQTTVDALKAQPAKYNELLAALRLLNGFSPSEKMPKYIKSIPLRSTMTDSQGRFSLQSPPGEYTLIAYQSRNVGEKTEHYFWSIAVQTGDTNIQLHNLNQAFLNR